MNPRALALALALACAALAACSLALDWRETASADGRFSVLLPGKPHEAARTLSTTTGAVDMHMRAAEAAGWQFGVAWADYPAAAAREPQRLIDAQRDALLRNTQARVIADQPAPLDGRPGRLVTAEGSNGNSVVTLQARFIVDGARLYQIAATGAKGGVDQAGIDTFLDSFKLTQPRP